MLNYLWKKYFLMIWAISYNTDFPAIGSSQSDYLSAMILMIPEDPFPISKGTALRYRPKAIIESCLVVKSLFIFKKKKRGHYIFVFCQPCEPIWWMMDIFWGAVVDKLVAGLFQVLSHSSPEFLFYLWLRLKLIALDVHARHYPALWNCIHKSESGRGSLNFRDYNIRRWSFKFYVI